MMVPYHPPHQQFIDWCLGLFCYLLWQDGRRSLAEFVVNSFSPMEEWECTKFQISGKGTIVIFEHMGIRYSTMLHGGWRKTI
jgi:hypothetical protein